MVDPDLHALMRGPRRQSALAWRDARDICTTVWPSRAAAVEQEEILHRAGWAVCVPERPGVVRRDGTVLHATVLEPYTWESPGDLVYRARAPRSPRSRRRSI